MFSRFKQQINYMRAELGYPGEAINYYQMNPELWMYQYGIFQNNQFIYDCPEPAQYSGIPRTSYDSRSSSEAGKREEAEAVDELLQILVECLRKADMRTREVLLKKFFFEIEKETCLEEFLVERIKKSKIMLLSERINPRCSRGSDRDIYKSDQTGKEINSVLMATGEADGLSGEESSEKMERFKVKTVHVGEVVKEESK